MKQLLILSGKGGTGKTTLASAFISLSNAKAYADCDVDAPNLHLAIKHAHDPKREDYYGLPKARIDVERCVACGKCLRSCKFDAVIADDKAYRIDDYACEGCGVCQWVCPTGAVSLEPSIAGEMMLYSADGRAFSTARLKMGSGNSGLLVTQVKKRLRTAMPDVELVIIDGSPGIGCPVIASISGVDMVLIVAEPSLSGISDLARIVQTAKGFGVKIAVCINKYDTGGENAGKIMAFCLQQGLPLAGMIPFDGQVIKAVNSEQVIVDMDCPAGRAVRAVYQSVMRLLYNGEENSVDTPAILA